MNIDKIEDLEELETYMNNQVSTFNEGIKQFNKLVDRVETLEKEVKQLKEDK